MSGMVWIVLGLVAVGFALGLPLSWLVLVAGRRTGAMDSAGARGHGKDLRAVPNTGGVAIFLAVALPVLCGLAAVALLGDETLGRWLPPLADHLARVRETMPTGFALVAGMAVLHVLGLVDDRRSLGPWPKLLVEVAVAAAMAVWFDVRVLDLETLPPGVSIVVTVLWIVAVTNAINFLDNMDGLAAGVSAIAASLFMVACIVNHQWFIASTLALLVGALGGFLVLNFPPAKIFMGDGGSLTIGFLLAVLTARTTYYGGPDYALGGGWYGVFMPLAVLAIPLYDLVSVTLLRVRQGRHLFVGDQQHFSHRLVQRGYSPRGAVLVIWGATLVAGVPGLLLGSLAGWQAVLAGLIPLLVLLFLASQEYASRRAAAGGRS
jgi:UDP-GlcNAc:undecaprenyl-phosphate GlcNAc-1-phosphate transferase